MNLSRQAILTTALAILDQYGLPDLSMRRIASSLGVQPGALYWHFASKQDLLAAMADAILDSLPPATGGTEELRDWAQHLDSILLAHHDGAELVWSVQCLRPWQAGLGFPVEQALVAAGVSPGQARAGAEGLLHLVLAHAFDQDQRRQAIRLNVVPSEPSDPAPALGDTVAIFVAGLQATAGGTPC